MDLADDEKIYTICPCPAIRNYDVNSKGDRCGSISVLDKTIDRQFGTTAVGLSELWVGNIPGFARLPSSPFIYAYVYSYLLLISRHDQPLFERWVNGCGFGTPPENSFFVAKYGTGPRYNLDGGWDVLYQELWLKLTVLKWLCSF